MTGWTETREEISKFNHIKWMQTRRTGVQGMGITKWNNNDLSNTQSSLFKQRKKHSKQKSKHKQYTYMLNVLNQEE